MTRARPGPPERAAAHLSRRRRAFRRCAGRQADGGVQGRIGERGLPRLIFAGVGGEGMEHEGLTSLFPLSDVAVMGPVAILRQLPKLIRRVYQTVDAAIAFAPDVVVIIDSPEFTHPIAKRIRKRTPPIPIIDYVSPSVWAWRPGRAKRMRAYVDHVLALLPFEPQAHRAPRRAAVHLCRPSPDRAQRLDRKPRAAGSGRAPGLPPGQAGARRAARQPPLGDRPLMQPFGETVALAAAGACRRSRS